FQEALGATADQKVHSPGGIAGWSGGEIPFQGSDLLVGLGGFVEGCVKFGKLLHDAPSSAGSSRSPSKGASTATAFCPRSRSQRTKGARNPCVTQTDSAWLSSITRSRPDQSA